VVWDATFVTLCHMAVGYSNRCLGPAAVAAARGACDGGTTGPRGARAGAPTGGAGGPDRGRAPGGVWAVRGGARGGRGARGAAAGGRGAARGGGGDGVPPRPQTLTGGCGGAHTTAPGPADLPRGGFGPRAPATVASLTGRQGLSQRAAQEVRGALFHLEVSRGSSAALERQGSAAVAQPAAAAPACVQAQDVANVDETGGKDGGQRRGLGVAVTALVSVFLLRATRGRQGAKDLRGPAYHGVVGSDRWSGYTWIDATQRHLCGAHLLRDFAACMERGGVSARLGRALLAAAAEMCGLWYRARDGTLRRAAFPREMRPIQGRLSRLLRMGGRRKQAQTRHACEHSLKVEAALWTFVTTEGVEPTNNAAERALRRAVLWRRRSFGPQSAEGRAVSLWRAC